MIPSQSLSASQSPWQCWRGKSGDQDIQSTGSITDSVGEVDGELEGEVDGELEGEVDGE
jgi:hypothetical protein